jgi:hypothetical protein
MTTLRRGGKRLTPRQVAISQLDMFGEVPVSRPDVYAWLMAVVNMDPASFRADDYVRNYQVLEKIVAAKLNGTFDQIVRRVRASARYRELAAIGRASQEASNSLGLGQAPSDLQPQQRMSMPAPAPRRPQEVIARERERAKLARRGRQKLRESLLNRLMPTRLPAFDAILADLGGADAEAIGTALRVSPTTVRRWLREGDAPHAAKFALFWMTQWGMSLIEANAHNDALNSQRIALLREGEAEQLRANLRQVERIADFGSANDPLPNVQARQPGPQGGGRVEGVAVPGPCPLPEEQPSARDVPIVFTSLRSAPCADSGRKKKSA